MPTIPIWRCWRCTGWPPPRTIPSEFRTAIETDEGLRRRLLGVLGASAALGDHLVANPAEWRLLGAASWSPERPTPEALRRTLLAAVDGDPDAEPTWGSGGALAGTTGHQAVAALRRAYRRSLLTVAARDVSDTTPEGSDVAAITAELSDLAAATLGAALAVAAAELPPKAPAARLAVIAMGKCGGHELNYVSDVDVIFIAQPGAPEPADGEDPAAGAASAGTPGAPVDTTAALRTATTLASSMMRICQTVAWPVDAALRPEGKDGPLVRTLASHEAYYRQWARTWEFQALLKARPIAGDQRLGQEWMDVVTPLVWGAVDRPGVVNDVRAMRRRVEESLPARDAEREIKLGRGGLRDIEFAIQLLQLVHGRGDANLRTGSTLDAIQALTDGGYIGRTDGESLAQSYRFLRQVEHRLQLQRLRRTHRVPDDDHGLRWLAQGLGYRGDARADAVERFTAEWTRHARDVRRLHEKLFYRPLLEAAASVRADAVRLRPDAARALLEVLGFADPGRRAAPHRGAHGRGEPPGHAPAGAAADDPADVRRRARPRRRPARVPEGLRAARPDALVPAVAPGRGAGRGPVRPAARHQPVRQRPARPGSGRVAAARRGRRAEAAVRRGAAWRAGRRGGSAR